MQDRPNSGLNFKDINLLLLLFADDMVVLGPKERHQKMHVVFVKS